MCRLILVLLPLFASLLGVAALSSLIGTDFVGKDGGDVYTYYLSLCGPLTSAAATSRCTPDPASAVSACQSKSGPNWSAAFVIGMWPPASAWSFIDPANEFVGVQYTMIGAQQCYIDSDPLHPTTFENYIANVQLRCASSQGSLTVATAPRSCVQNFTLSTPLACPPPAVERSIFLADE